ncbi:MAG: TOBE domain-containing protein, partial [Planctomyces sp.]
LPPMNMLDGEIEGDGATACFVIREQGVRVQMSGYGGAKGPSTMGIRPQSLRVVDGEVSGGAGLRVRVRVVEPLGSEMDIHADLIGGASPLVARVAARDDVRAGDEVRMVLENDGLHVFAPGEFGATLWSGTRQG